MKKVKEPITLKEKDIVDEIIKRFKEFFPDMEFWRREYSIRDFRVDIAASVRVNYKDIGLTDYDHIQERAPVFIEVKYNSEMRDLLFELQKQINMRDWQVNVCKNFYAICVISDKFNSHMVDFMEENGVFMYQLFIKDNDLSTLTIKEYDPIMSLIAKDIDETLLV